MLAQELGADLEEVDAPANLGANLFYLAYLIMSMIIIVVGKS